MKKVPKVVVIGLDAATWTVIRPCMAEGKMPNLAKLMKAGVSGTLESILPPITPPAWTSFMTGKNPGKHGIFHFVETEYGGYAMKYANATSRRSPTVWKLLNNAGYSVGTMNIPFTYPPEPLNGFQISGMDTPSETSPFIHPPELREELVKHLGGIQLDLRFLGAMSTDERRNQVLAEMEQMDNQWTKAALYLLENHPQDVMMFVFMSIDTVQHYFWQHMDKGHFLHDLKLAPKFGDAVRKVYERLDAAAGQIIDLLPPETTLFVVSDHGGGPVVDRTIFLNRYLAQLGLLNYDEMVAYIIEKLAELKDPRSGKPVINRVYRRNEIFHGPFSREGADLVLDWWSEDSLFSSQPSFPEDTGKPALIIREHRPSETSEWGGTHRLNGILIGRGSGFKSGAEIANARLIDIAPT